MKAEIRSDDIVSEKELHVDMLWRWLILFQAGVSHKKTMDFKTIRLEKYKSGFARTLTMIKKPGHRDILDHEYDYSMRKLRILAKKGREFSCCFKIVLDVVSWFYVHTIGSHFMQRIF